MVLLALTFGCGWLWLWLVTVAVAMAFYVGHCSNCLARQRRILVSEMPNHVPIWNNCRLCPLFPSPFSISQIENDSALEKNKKRLKTTAKNSQSKSGAAAAYEAAKRCCTG